MTGWILSVGVLFCMVYGLVYVDLSKFAAATFSSLCHTVWAAALAWVVIACSTGNGGFVNEFLSATYLYPFSRVTYCAYLVHPILLRVFVFTPDASFHMGIETLV